MFVRVWVHMSGVIEDLGPYESSREVLQAAVDIHRRGGRNLWWEFDGGDYAFLFRGRHGLVEVVEL